MTIRYWPLLILLVGCPPKQRNGFDPYSPVGEAADAFYEELTTLMEPLVEEPEEPLHRILQEHPFPDAEPSALSQAILGLDGKERAAMLARCPEALELVRDAPEAAELSATTLELYLEKVAEQYRIKQGTDIRAAVPCDQYYGPDTYCYEDVTYNTLLGYDTDRIERDRKRYALLVLLRATARQPEPSEEAPDPEEQVPEPEEQVPEPEEEQGVEPGP